MTLNQLESWSRTNMCGDLRKEATGKEVILMGWVNNRRDHGGVIFIDLRDYTGLCQIVFGNQHDANSFERADTLRSENVIAIKGIVADRADNMINPKMVTGEIEIFVTELKILNTCKNLPLQISDEQQEVNEKTRLKYRTLDLRRPAMQENLMLRSKAAQVVRNFFYDSQFFEIDTPFLTRSTPEGARDFLVPSRVNPGKFFALPQSPQLFKQMLMISGYDRYFQIVKCFRDEDLRGNRQPEFTQIDIEMSFTDQAQVISVVEKMVQKLFKETINVDVQLPIIQMTYAEAMDDYGVDAPDLRYDLKLKDVSSIIKGCGFKVFSGATDKGGIVKTIMVPNGSSLSRKELDDFTDFVKIFKSKGMAWAKINEDGWQSPIAKFFTEEEIQAINEKTGAKPGDLILFGADTSKIVNDSLGNLRKEIAKKLGLVNDDVFKFVWVTDFPLFEYDETEKRYSSSHHPFTMPVIEDLEKWGETDPSKIKSIAYDLVLNGVELGGGSIRIHQKEIQEKIFKLLNLSDQEIKEKFGFFIESLEFGAPPHGGLAFGFDRIMMFLNKASSIRDVIPFPKTQQASCLLTEAPSDVALDQLKELGLAIRKSNQ
ncbi:MAG: aspartate--tRNA ligase [Deltaproteobacteria bacterium]|nr:aspartate--tRNA ligase [Deltaproteobacteria bacterium]